ncbi:MAG: hypothetical protein PHF12_00420 [Candidatus Omnitrophica bacterium]|nr:hypothetical protein [Candidatus Omnitrophota bacterium]
MSLLTRGTNKLSQLEIDVSKDWAGHLIKNIGPAAENADALRKVEAVLQTAMATKGDILFRGDSEAERLIPDAGKGYSFLRSRGAGLSPVWQDIESLIQFMTGAVNRAAAFDLSIPPPAVSQVTQQASNPPGRVATSVLSPPEPEVTVDLLTGPGGAVTSSPTLDVPTPGVSEQAAIGSPVSGAVADDGGVKTDETAQANNDTANDMTLLPPVPAVNDAYYFGRSSLWDWLELRMGTAGNGIWDIVWEYWNGAWIPLADIIDNTSGFRVTGTRLVTFTRSLDWLQTTIGGIANLFWIRARVSAYASVVTQPKGTRAFTWIKY